MIITTIWWGVIVWVCFWALILFIILGAILGSKRR